MKACCLVHRQVQATPLQLNYQRLKDAGVLVVVRLNWGYADGTGTVPPPQYRDAHVDALVKTINDCQGAWGFTIGNEVNNPSEWPGGYPNPSYHPTPAYYASIYNGVAARVDAKLSPVSLDPYNVVAQEFGLPGDPRDWAQVIYDRISRLDFVCLHAKTQTNDPAECWSYAGFTHPPLVGRYLHLRTVEDQRAWIPQQWRDRPVFVTELNPQHTASGLGWERGNAEWVQQAMAYMRSLGWITGVMFYRYDRAGDQAGFGLDDKPVILDAIVEEA